MVIKETGTLEEEAAFSALVGFFFPEETALGLDLRKLWNWNFRYFSSLQKPHVLHGLDFSFRP